MNGLDQKWPNEFIMARTRPAKGSGEERKEEKQEEERNFSATENKGTEEEIEKRRLIRENKRNEKECRLSRAALMLHAKDVRVSTEQKLINSSRQSGFL